MNFKIKSVENLSEYLHQINFLFVTATPTETRAVQQAMRPLVSESGLVVIRKQAMTYFLGRFGRHTICQVECSMGSVGVGASSLTTQQAITDWRIKAVIMVGIAFGIDIGKQQIGDVLLANPIIPYEKKRVGTNDTIPRGHAQTPSPILVNYFRHTLDWEHQLKNGELSRLYIGPVLSGEVLVDNIKYRDGLLKQCPEAVGGEMEGAGLVSAAYTHHVPWILIKGICDFADGEKGKNKKENQQEAIKAALSLCLYVFEQDDFFAYLLTSAVGAGVSIKDKSDLLVETSEKKWVNVDGAILAQATFNVYSKAVEPYYLNRKLDNEFYGFLNTSKSIWLYGVSGLGKTNLVYRNVFRKWGKFHVVDLSGCTLLNGISVLNYINQQLLEIKGLAKSKEAENLPSALDELLKTLRTYYGQDDYIVFEEVPVSGYHKEPVEAIILLLVKYFNLSVAKHCRFAFTSIPNPRVFLDASTAKITERVRFQQLNYWEDSDLLKLCSIIEQASGLILTTEEQGLMRVKSKGSPRYIKAFYANMHAMISCDMFEFDNCIDQTNEDLYGNG